MKKKKMKKIIEGLGTLVLENNAEIRDLYKKENAMAEIIGKMSGDTAEGFDIADRRLKRIEEYLWPQPNEDRIVSPTQDDRTDAMPTPMTDKEDAEIHGS